MKPERKPMKGKKLVLTVAAAVVAVAISIM